MKKNLTLAIEEQVLEEARKRALERGTSVNQMVREYLEKISGIKEKRRKSLEELEKLIEEIDMKVGEIDWSREELHER